MGNSHYYMDGSTQVKPLRPSQKLVLEIISSRKWWGDKSTTKKLSGTLQGILEAAPTSIWNATHASTTLPYQISADSLEEAIVRCRGLCSSMAQHTAAMPPLSVARPGHGDVTASERCLPSDCTVSPTVAASLRYYFGYDHTCLNYTEQNTTISGLSP